MLKKQKHLNAIAIIPARGGSKRIPKKNIRPFLGEPIIKYSIDAAHECGIFDEVMVSTDSDEIAKISLKFNAKVPFMRSAKNASDFATLSDVMMEVVKEYQKIGIAFDYFCCILPTVPTIMIDNIIKGYKLIIEKDINAVMPVVEYGFPVQRALEVTGDGYVCMQDKQNETKRSQDLPPVYHDAGRFLWIRTDTFIKSGTLFVNKTFPIIIPRILAQDIDNEEDWKIAEMKYLLKNKNLRTKKNKLLFQKLLQASIGAILLAESLIN